MKKLLSGLLIVVLGLLLSSGVSAQVFSFKKNRHYIGNGRTNYNVMQFERFTSRHDIQATRKLFTARAVADTTVTDTTYNDTAILSYYLGALANYIDTADIVATVDSILNTSYTLSSTAYLSPAVSLQLFSISDGSVTSVPSLSLGYGIYFKPKTLFGMDSYKWNCDYLFGLSLFGSAGLSSSVEKITDTDGNVTKKISTSLNFGINPMVSIWDGYLAVGYMYSTDVKGLVIGTSLSL